MSDSKSYTHLSEDAAHLYKEISELYELGPITRELHTEWHGFIINELDGTCNEEIRDVLPVLRENYPNEHYWTDYIDAVNCKDMTRRSELLRISADSGNPYAAYMYADVLLQNNCDVELDVVARYLDMGVAIGYAEVIRRRMTLYMPDGMREYLEHNCATVQARHTCIKELLHYADMLGDEVHVNGGIDDVLEIYEHARDHEYPVPMGQVSWSHKIYALKIDGIRHSSLPVKALADQTDIIIEVADDYEKIRARNIELEREVAILRRLQGQTLDDVCKSVISEYAG